MAVILNDLVAFEYYGEPVNARIFLIEDQLSVPGSTTRRMIIHIQDRPQGDQPYTEIYLDIADGEEKVMEVEELSRRLSEKYR